MRERPIIFSGAMVRAILEGRKTQTRRVVRRDCQQYVGLRLDAAGVLRQGGLQEQAWTQGGRYVRCPYGVPGDRLWVRETWQYEPLTGGPTYEEVRDSPDFFGYRPPNHGLFYLASEDEAGQASMHWRPSIHMHRWASRLTLEVKAVRVERLQEISEADALSEGVESWRASWNQKTAAEAFLRGTEAAAATEDAGPAKRLFYLLWQSINAKRGHSWESNPFVWVVEFERRKP